MCIRDRFSVVWGLALVLATVLLRQEKDRSDRYLLAFGTVMGGVYEYCLLYTSRCV